MGEKTTVALAHDLNSFDIAIIGRAPFFRRQEVEAL